VAANGIRRAIRLGSHMEKNDKGQFATPTFMPGQKPSRDWALTAMQLARMGNMAARGAAMAEQDDHGKPSGMDRVEEDEAEELSTDEMDV
jgi:hypothetical protein